jgi:hypothetical protein
MTAALLDRERLAKLCEMFGSNFPGERANAAMAADKLIRAAGLRWSDVILTGALPVPPRSIDNVANIIRFVLQHADLLTAWEFEFIEGVERQHTPISTKQREILDRIVKKARRAGARAA